MTVGPISAKSEKSISKSMSKKLLKQKRKLKKMTSPQSFKLTVMMRRNKNQTSLSRLRSFTLKPRSQNTRLKEL